MKEVYYKGRPYECQIAERDGKRQFHLFENGVKKYTVTENELDIKSVVSLILDSYYRNIRTAAPRSTVLS